MLDASDLRCICCGAVNLVPKAESSDDKTLHGGISCAECGGSYDVIDGVPFLGGYEPEDFIGLIEVVATGMKNQTPIDILFARHLHELLRLYHFAVDKAAFVADYPDEIVRAPWFAEHRYHEWMQVDALLGGKELAGKKLLHIGAGIGFDSVPFVDARAQVTCIDYSPTIVALGRKALPEVRWIGGFSHALPFQDEVFDFVCSNAAMHRMRSTPTALREMLRVLKPGGFLFTTGDPVRPDDSDDTLEFDVFNRHEGVLSGVNEGIIRFGEFFDTLAEFGEHIDFSLIATVPEGSGIEGATPIGDGSFNDCWVPSWPQNIEILRKQSGGLCVAVIKREAFAIAATRQSPFVLPAGMLATWLSDPDTAFARLLAWAPDNLVNLPFPGQEQDWFSLLNGWMAPEAPFETRKGFQRARWLLNQPGASSIIFSARMVAGSATLDVLVNGKSVVTTELGASWAPVGFQIPAPTIGTAFLVELRLASALDGLGFDERCFEVRDRQLI